jgi:S1-C subfamily serine protease
MVTSDQPVGDGPVDQSPRADPVVQETWPRDAAKSDAQALAGHDHLRPPTLGVLARQVLSGTPAIDADGAVVSAALPGDPESIAGDPRVDVCQPSQLENVESGGLQDEVTG